MPRLFYLLVNGTGKVLPLTAFLIKYTFGFLLWAWMFWYGYKVHIQKHLAEHRIKEGHVILICIVSMLVILLAIRIDCCLEGVV